MTLQQLQFGPIEVTYDEEVLEPRPWTLEQSRWAAALLADLPDGRVLELCAGVGHIGLVAAVKTRRALVQVDVDSRACTLARGNAVKAGVSSDVRCGDLEDVLVADERFPLVLADPPYVPTEEVDNLPQDPKGAIDGGADGLDIARTCVAVAAAHVLEGGAVLLQLASVGQADRLGPDIVRHGLETAEVRAIGDQGVVVLLR